MRDNGTKPVDSINEKSAIRCMQDVMGGKRSRDGRLIDKIPPKDFGKGKARIVRKLVLLAIAASADRDGTNSKVSRETIAHRCLISVEAVRKAIKYWSTRRAPSTRLKVDSRAGWSSPRGRTNLYTIVFREPKKPRLKASVAVDGSATATMSETPATTEQTPATSDGTLATIERTSANESCYNRSLDRYSDRSIDREIKTAQSSRSSLSRDIEANPPVQKDQIGNALEEEDRQLGFLWQCILEIEDQAMWNRRDAAELKKIIAKGHYTDREIKYAVARIITSMDGFALKRAGDALVAKLSPVIEQYRKEETQRERAQARAFAMSEEYRKKVESKPRQEEEIGGAPEFD
jgi:hypothetical protein